MPYIKATLWTLDHRTIFDPGSFCQYQINEIRNPKPSNSGVPGTNSSGGETDKGDTEILNVGDWTNGDDTGINKAKDGGTGAHNGGDKINDGGTRIAGMTLAKWK